MCVGRSSLLWDVYENSLLSFPFLSFTDCFPFRLDGRLYCTFVGYIIRWILNGFAVGLPMLLYQISSNVDSDSSQLFNN